MCIYIYIYLYTLDGEIVVSVSEKMRTVIHMPRFRQPKAVGSAQLNEDHGASADHKLTAKLRGVGPLKPPRQ